MYTELFSRKRLKFNIFSKWQRNFKGTWGGWTRNYKKMLTLSFENIHVLSSNSSLPIYYNIFSILVHCAKDAEIIQPVVEEDEENDEELEFEIWRKPQLPKMATVAIVSEMEKNRPNNTLMGITPDSSSESSWSMKLWKSNLKWKRRKRKKCNMKWLDE